MAQNALFRPPLEPRIAFWTRPFFWPEEPSDKIFAARAIIEVGKRVDGWSNEFAAIDLTSELPASLTTFTDPREIRRGLHLLERDESSE